MLFSFDCLQTAGAVSKRDTLGVIRRVWSQAWKVDKGCTLRALPLTSPGNMIVLLGNCGLGDPQFEARSSNVIPPSKADNINSTCIQGIISWVVIFFFPIISYLSLSSSHMFLLSSFFFYLIRLSSSIWLHDIHPNFEEFPILSWYIHYISLHYILFYYIILSLIISSHFWGDWSVSHFRRWASPSSPLIFHALLRLAKTRFWNVTRTPVTQLLPRILEVSSHKRSKVEYVLRSLVFPFAFPFVFPCDNFGLELYQQARLLHWNCIGSCESKP